MRYPKKKTLVNCMKETFATHPQIQIKIYLRFNCRLASSLLVIWWCDGQKRGCLDYDQQQALLKISSFHRFINCTQVLVSPLFPTILARASWQEEFVNNKSGSFSFDHKEYLQAWSRRPSEDFRSIPCIFFFYQLWDGFKQAIFLLQTEKWRWWGVWWRTRRSERFDQEDKQMVQDQKVCWQEKENKGSNSRLEEVLKKKKEVLH